jgi:hypothetical protein
MFLLNIFFLPTNNFGFDVSAEWTGTNNADTFLRPFLKTHGGGTWQPRGVKRDQWNSEDIKVRLSALNPDEEAGRIIMPTALYKKA